MKNFTIETQRLLIRNLRETDLDAFHPYRSDPEVTKYQGFDVMTVDQARDFILSQKDLEFGVPGQWLQLGIESKATGKIIGDCAIKLQGDDPRIAETGITISADEQLKGYGKETLLGILKTLFEQHDIHRIVEIVDAENAASIALLESTGFRKEGHFIENIFFKGKWGSECQYAMLRREWLKKRPD